MKVSRRFTPLDMLAFEHKEYRVTISTHRNTLAIGVSKDGRDIHNCHLTPDQFISLLMRDTPDCDHEKDCHAACAAQEGPTPLVNDPNAPSRADLERQLAESRAERDRLTADGERLDWLEATMRGKGNSAFLKSVFLTTEFGSDRICVDVKGEGVFTRDTLRAAIDAAKAEDRA